MTNKTTPKTIECERCSGQGYIRGFAHVKDGVCFKCGGSGKVNAPRAKSANQIAKEEAKRAAKEAESTIKAQEYNRKLQAAKVIYANDPRIVNNQWYKDNPQMDTTLLVITWAQYDKVWNTL